MRSMNPALRRVFRNLPRAPWARTLLQAAALPPAFLALSFCAPTGAQTPAPAALRLERQFGGASFTQPLGMLQAPGVSDVFYILEQRGAVIAVDRAGRKRVFLDIVDRTRSGGELGLLGLAFYPDWTTRYRAIVSYTRPGRKPVSTLAIFRSRNRGANLDRNSEQRIFSLEQPYSNHNGGQVAFGPDGMLYFALGDGGSGGDPLNHGQNMETLFGSILRLDVSRAPPYRIPPDNPFVGRAGRDEIYAYGLRNPWRFSFDRVSGELWAADVGQNAIEEINKIRAGGNYGWRAKEGRACFDPELCNRPGFIDPVHEYRHGPHCSVTGGYVYRGSELRTLVGAYIFGDFCSGYIWALDANGQARELIRSNLKLSAFGEDLAGELYALDYTGGVYRLRAPGI